MTWNWKRFGDCPPLEGEEVVLISNGYTFVGRLERRFRPHDLAEFRDVFWVNKKYSYVPVHYDMLWCSVERPILAEIQ